MQTILVERTYEFEKEIKRLNKKAPKIGVAPIVFRQLGWKTVERRIAVTSDFFDGEKIEKQPVNVMEYEIDLPFVEDPAWQLVARIEPLEGSPRHFVDAFEKDFDRSAWEFSDFNCAHCHAKRHRNLMYIVRNKATAQLIQLGRNCFEDYVGKNKLAQLEFRAFLAQFFGEGDDDFIFPGGGGGRKAEVIPLKTIVLTAEAMAHVEGGWRNNQYDRIEGHVIAEGTHRRAARMLTSKDAFNTKYDNSGKTMRQLINDILKDDSALLDVLVARVEKAIEDIREMDAQDDFSKTLQYACSFENVPVQKASIVAYLCQFFRNAEEHAAREAKKATARHVGTIGKREVFELKCVRCHTFDTDFGTMHANTFEDADGNQLVWMTGSASFTAGEEVKLKGTVKAHSEYKGMKQTELSRCKVIENTVTTPA
jgi:hypothetical protein